MIRSLVSLVVMVMSMPTPPQYRAVRSSSGIDDLLSPSAQDWKAAAEVEWGPSPYPTRFRALWNNQGLFVRFDATDDAPWHTMSNHDDHLWEEEVVEIFVDPDRSGRNYAELEINPANVICDVRMIEPSPNKQMDLAWNFLGLQSRVTPLGGSGKPTIGWTATAFMPWSDFSRLSQKAAVPMPPGIGDRWRFNLFRIKRPGGKERPEDGAVLAAWSPNDSPSFHVPAAFGDLIFVER
jgi:hypothetical protein